MWSRMLILGPITKQPFILSSVTGQQNTEDDQRLPETLVRHLLGSRSKLAPLKPLPLTLSPSCSSMAQTTSST